MKILWMNTQLFPSVCDKCGFTRGAEAAWGEHVLKALKESDHNIQITVAYCDRRPCDVYCDGVRHISYCADEYYYYRKVPSKLVARIMKLIKEINPDIIHIHGTETFYSSLPIEVYCGKPVVVTILGLISGCAPVYNGNLSPREISPYFMNAGFVRKLSTVFSEQSFWMTKRAVKERLALQQHRYFIGRTNWDKACVHYYNSNAKYYHVNETLRPDFFDAERYTDGIVSHSIFCSAAANYPLKAVHWLIRAVANLKGEFPDITLKIADAEDKLGNLTFRRKFYSNSYASYLRALIKKLNVQDNIVPLPRLSARSVSDELCRAQLFVLPSLMENSSNSLGEAMLVGVPVIATFVGGTPSVLRDGVDGVLVPPSDPYLLSYAIREAFCNYEEMLKFADNAKIIAKGRHDPQKNAEQLVNVYKDILKEEGK